MCRLFITPMCCWLCVCVYFIWLQANGSYGIALRTFSFNAHTLPHTHNTYCNRNNNNDNNDYHDNNNTALSVYYTQFNNIIHCIILLLFFWWHIWGGEGSDRFLSISLYVCVSICYIFSKIKLRKLQRNLEFMTARLHIVIDVSTAGVRCAFEHLPLSEML